MNRIKNRLIVPALLVMVSLLGLTACKENKEDVSPTPEATEDYVLETVEEQVLFDESGVISYANNVLFPVPLNTTLLIIFVPFD